MVGGGGSGNQGVPSDKVNKNASANAIESSSAGAAGSHYNIMEKLKELYRELKGDKTCKEVSRFFEGLD